MKAQADAAHREKISSKLQKAEKGALHEAVVEKSTEESGACQNLRVL